MSLPEPSTTVTIKLASLAIHAEEALSPTGHAYDKTAIDAILQDPEVRSYLAQLDARSRCCRENEVPHE